MKKLLLFLWIAGFYTVSYSQEKFAKAEKELKKMAFEILNHDSLEHKISVNKKFTEKLLDILRNPESFNYRFDSLQTISILNAEDKSFRIFTWYIVDKNYREMYGEQYHYYFGLIQRNVPNPKKPGELIIIPLIQQGKIQASVENEPLTNMNWIGALYYPIKGESGLPVYKIKYYEKAKQMFSEKIIENYNKSRKTGKPQKFKGEKQKAQKKNFYLLLGWNGGDNTCNYKMVDLLHFDEKDPTVAKFGADVFYFDFIPKFRAVFKYSEYAPFSLNMGKVKRGPFSTFDKDMLVYDHLAVPLKSKEMKQVWDLGPDGSYDALGFYNRLGSRGIFEWYKNITLADGSSTKISAAQKKKIEEAREQAAKDLYGDKYKEFLRGNEDLNRKMTAKEIRKREEEEKRKLKEAGINLDKPKK
ncbi:MAG: hypothetical protein K1X92_02945 [Bacteroidia bacterium]|nr:hypothetical protein [Bacteroidia bacterium]